MKKYIGVIIPSIGILVCIAGFITVACKDDVNYFLLAYFCWLQIIFVPSLIRNIGKLIDKKQPIMDSIPKQLKSISDRQEEIIKRRQEIIDLAKQNLASHEMLTEFETLGEEADLLYSKYKEIVK